MSGHTVTPYELTAVRKHVRLKGKEPEPLLLASIAKDRTIDLLDAIASHVEAVSAVTSSDETRAVSCVETRRDGNALLLVIAQDVSGEREVVLDGDDPQRPVVFTKGEKHVTRIHSCCMVWRPASGTAGLLLMHSPWNRGGSRASVLRLIQRAVDAEEGAKAKLHADPMIPAKALERLLRQAKATRITYSKAAGVRTEFDDNGLVTSAPAELDLVVRGSDSVPFRDALASALRKPANRQKLFTIKVRDDDADGGYREETFDDVEVAIETAAGSKTYSIAQNTVPTMGFNITSEVNHVYAGLPEDDEGRGWPALLLDGLSGRLAAIAAEVTADT